MTASPETPEEMDIFDRLHRRHSHVSFERILALESRDATWSAGMTPDAIRVIRAGLLGSFAGSVALAFGAWDGVYVGGPQMAALTTPEPVGSFHERFVSKGRYRNQLVRVPIWGIEQTNVALTGAAACLAALNS